MAGLCEGGNEPPGSLKAIMAFTTGEYVWAYENPRETVPSHHQVRFYLNMWAGIIGDRLVGPHVLVNRLTGRRTQTSWKTPYLMF
ncbi:hypothetical protein ANN_08233 [Periplaneta americana]|uniref:Uncharacterized protein n=1 Tax=Periplaneta americana TaxID=6978 RepID=A0ABQ8T335_PERAM|nr:hypothetical protein ANN_08233 [Periplaneta americana]